MKAQMQKGFTLIELMIVVAIIGILAAVALPAYSDYQAKAKMTAGLAEIAGLKTAYELIINDGKKPSEITVGDLTSKTGTNNCTIAVIATGGIKCTVLKAPTQLGDAPVVSLTRADDALWTCSTNVTEKYTPTGCTPKP